jgi:hypothetical protein
MSALTLAAKRVVDSHASRGSWMPWADLKEAISQLDDVLKADQSPALQNLECVSAPGLDLSKRDWFAGMALQGAMANPATAALWSATAMAQACYSQADAMLVAGKDDA